MTATHYEDIAFQLSQEEYPVWEAEEKQERNKRVRKALNYLQDFIRQDFLEGGKNGC